MSTLSDILNKARAYTQQSPFLKKVVNRANLVSPLVGPIATAVTGALNRPPTQPVQAKPVLSKQLAGPEYFKNIVDNDPDMNMKKAAQGWLDRHSQNNGFQGLWGTNQDYQGPGGFNYATPQAALAANQPVEDRGWDMGNSGGYDAGNNTGSGMDKSQFNTPTPTPTPTQNMSSSPYDIAKYKHEVLNSSDMPLEDLYRAAQGLNDSRNDIATGTTDPFNLGVHSNIPFSPDQLAGIEKRLAGSYDPAINDVNARILAKMDANKNAASGSSWGTGFMSTIPNQFRDEINNQQKAYATEPIIKNLQTIAPAYTFITSIDPNKATNSEMQAALIGFTKNLDPTSVVREGELALTTAYASNPTLLNKLKQEWAKSVTTGQVLQPYALKQVIAAFQKNYEGVLKNANAVKKQYADSLKYNYGLNDEQVANVLHDYTAAGYSPSTGGFSMKNPYEGKDYMSYYDYSTDVGLAKDSIARGADRNAVLSALKQKYAQVNEADLNFSNVGGGTNSASNRPQRNNNPLNIKASSTTMRYPGVAGLDHKPAADGGKFLVFNSPEAGFNAAKNLIRSNGYSNLSVDQALRRWSGNGYGGEIVPPQYRGRTIASLSDAEITKLLKTMASREGYYA